MQTNIITHIRSSSRRTCLLSFNHAFPAKSSKHRPIPPSFLNEKNKPKWHYIRKGNFTRQQSFINSTVFRIGNPVVRPFLPLPPPYLDLSLFFLFADPFPLFFWNTVNLPAIRAFGLVKVIHNSDFQRGGDPVRKRRFCVTDFSTVLPFGLCIFFGGRFIHRSLLNTLWTISSGVDMFYAQGLGIVDKMSGTVEMNGFFCYD